MDKKLFDLEWYHMGSGNGHECCFQDTVHILTKMRTRLLKPGIILPIGKFLITVDHLKQLMTLFKEPIHEEILNSLIDDDERTNSIKLDLELKDYLNEITSITVSSQYVEVKLKEKSIIVKKSPRFIVSDKTKSKGDKSVKSSVKPKKQVKKKFKKATNEIITTVNIESEEETSESEKSPSLHNSSDEIDFTGTRELKDEPECRHLKIKPES
ncbi:hypothetical protein FQR65_LT18338 [Abscondita terminalis]|nr:hypothetical protein FQR65_LT18338 [Abscondita terminalis]